MSYYGRSYDRSGLVVGLIVTGVVLAIVGVLGWLWGWDVYILRALFITGPGQVLGGVVIAAVLLGVGGYLVYDKWDRVWPTAVAVLALVVGFFFIPFNATHEVQKRYLPTGSFVVEDATFTDYEQRVPYEIAARQVNNNMGDFMGESYGVKSLAAEGEYGLWNTLVAARGFGVGYEGIVSIDSPHYGNVAPSNVKRCEFNTEKATMRVGGWLPANDLGREIQRRLFWSSVTFSGEDVYGYCHDGVPIVVIPLVENQGFIFMNAVPWGVAVYNGATGEVTITQDADEIAKLDGPTYPISIARQQREALQSYNGDWWEHVQGKLGWDTVGNTEIQLRLSDTGTAQYFTGLQPRGASVAVVAEFTVDSRMLTPGSLNPIRVNKLDQPRDGDTAIADTIYSNYSHMPEFAGSKYDVYEIVPSKDGEWVASIGTDQSVVYRVRISADGDKLTLLDRNGKEIAYSVGGPDDGGATTVVGDLSGMTERELLELMEQIVDRLQDMND